MTKAVRISTVIYGAGSVARKLLASDLLESELRDTKGQVRLISSTGQEAVSGFEVAPVDSLHELDFERLIIASSFVVPILNKLARYHVDANKLFIYEPDKHCLIPLKQLNTANPSKTLYAIYDLEANPATFDCVFFVANAQAYARMHGFAAIHFVLVPGIGNTGRLGDGGYCLNDAAVYRWKIDSVLVPVLQMATLFGGMTILNERSLSYLSELSSQVCFPAEYTAESPSDCHNPSLLRSLYQQEPAAWYQDPVFEPGRLAEQYVQSLLEKTQKKVVCVTLREYAFQPGRNNVSLCWLALLNHISGLGYRVILIRDTFMAHQALPEAWQHFEVCEPASWSVGIRLALYKKSWLNLCSNTGPANLLYFLPESHYLVFNLLGLDGNGAVSDIVTSSEFFRTRYHLEENDTQFFFAANPYQRLVWHKDQFESMKQAFEGIERELNSHE